MFTLSRAPLPIRPTPLRSQQIFRVQGWQGQRIECLDGHVWVTQDRDVRDVVLGAREGFTFDRSGPVLVHALENASFRVDDAGSVAARPAGSPRRLPAATPAASGCAACY